MMERYFFNILFWLLVGVAAIIGISCVSAATITATNTIGSVPDDFVGYHTGLWPGSNRSRIDCNGDGNEDCFSNSTEHQLAMVEAGTRWITGDFNPEDNMLDSTTFKNVISNFADILNRVYQSWTRDYGIDVHYRIFGMPDFVANTSGCSTTRTCTPDNYTEWYEVLDSLIQITECDVYTDWCTLVFWNEEDLDNFFLSNIAEINTTREQRFIEFANNTLHWLNSTYPDIRVCAVTPSTFDDSTSRRQTAALIGNLSPDLYDCLAPHEYQWNAFDPDYDVQINDSINFLYGFCDANPAHTARCSDKPIYWGEAHARNQTWLTTEQNRAQNQLWLLASQLLNRGPNHRFAVYRWTAVQNRTVETSNPLFTTYYEAQYSGGTPIKMSAFNVTRDLTAWHGNGTIYNYTSTSSNVLAIITERSNETAVTIINKGSSATGTITVNMPDTLVSVSSLTGDNVSFSTNKVTLGSIPAYDQSTFVAVGSSQIQVEETSIFAAIRNGLVAIKNGMVMFK